MKRLLFLLSAPLWMAPALCAETQLERDLQQLNEQRDRAAAAAMVPVNRSYQAGLQQLLKRSVDLHDLEANAKIVELLRGLNAPTDAMGVAPSAQTPLAAKIETMLTGSQWLHMNTFHYTFTKSGNVILAEPHPRGKYHINGKTGAVTLRWEGVPEEVLLFDEKTNTFSLHGPFVPITKP